MGETILLQGSYLSYSHFREGWDNAVLEGEYTEEQQEKLAHTAERKRVEQIDSLLPEGCWWNIHASMIIGPEGTDLDSEEIKELLQQTPYVPFEEIEEEALTND